MGVHGIGKRHACVSFEISTGLDSGGRFCFGTFTADAIDLHVSLVFSRSSRLILLEAFQPPHGIFWDGPSGLRRVAPVRRRLELDILKIPDRTSRDLAIVLSLPLGAYFLAAGKDSGVVQGLACQRLAR